MAEQLTDEKPHSTAPGNETNYLLYDGDCAVCTKMVAALKSVDKKNLFTTVPFQQSGGLSIDTTELDFDREIYLYTRDGGLYKGPDAYLYALRHSQISAVGKVLSLPVLRHVFSALYYAFAENRYLFNPCDENTCYPSPKSSSLTSHAVLTGAFILTTSVGLFLYALSLKEMSPSLSSPSAAALITATTWLALAFTLLPLFLISRASAGNSAMSGRDLFLSLTYRLLVALTCTALVLLIAALLNTALGAFALDPGIGAALNTGAVAVCVLMIAYIFIKLAAQIQLPVYAALAVSVSLYCIGLALFKATGIL
ncbi:MAG: DUF393 domain-containing protein [Candidatus Dadabacteria bacterium]|nr:DUF393 domain-containing protein [Candidatus Dadabacteria bacterium]